MVPVELGRLAEGSPADSPLSWGPRFLERCLPLELLVAPHYSHHPLLHHQPQKNYSWYCLPEGTIETAFWSWIHLSDRPKGAKLPLLTFCPNWGAGSIPPPSEPDFPHHHSIRCGSHSCWPPPRRHCSYSMDRCQQISLIVVRHLHHHYN